MAQSNIYIKIDENLKKQFDFLCNEFGLTMSAAINIFVKTVVRENRIPLDLSLHVPNETTKKAIEDTEKGIGLHGPFNSVDDMMKDLLSEDDEV